MKHKIARHKVAKAHRNKKLIRLYKPPISVELLLRSFLKILYCSGLYFVPLCLSAFATEWLRYCSLLSEELAN
ncbi:MAG: hypothetical protein J7L53_03265 [Deltaproteobacteria bacterium]|nr:hypothetical protein [Deltaproteobacteria bacterium]